MSRHLRLIPRIAACFALAVPRATAEPPQRAPARVRGVAYFESKVRPVLVRSCLPCHGSKKRRGDLRLDSRAALLKGGEHGPAVVAEMRKGRSA